MLMTGEVRASWEFAEGDAIAPGRTVRGFGAVLEGPHPHVLPGAGDSSTST
jgi:hypothetical protein